MLQVTDAIVRHQAAQTQSEFEAEERRALWRAARAQLGDLSASIGLIVGFFLTLPIGVICPPVLIHIAMRLLDRHASLEKTHRQVNDWLRYAERYDQRGWRILRIEPVEGGFRATARYARRHWDDGQPPYSVIGNGLTREDAVLDALSSASRQTDYPDLLS